MWIWVDTMRNEQTVVKDKNGIYEWLSYTEKKVVEMMTERIYPRGEGERRRVRLGKRSKDRVWEYGSEKGTSKSRLEIKRQR